MGSVEKRVRNGVTTWQARWRDPAGRQRKKSFPRKLDADRHLVVVEPDLLRGTYIDHRAGLITVAEFAETRWLPSLVHVRPNTLDLYRAHLRNHVLPAFGSRSLGSVRRSDCRTFVAALAARLAPATVSTVYAVLRMVMQTPVDDGLIAANPCSRVPLPRIEHRGDRAGGGAVCRGPRGRHAGAVRGEGVARGRGRPAGKVRPWG